jgi:S1-C subfamily serine protease
VKNNPTVPAVELIRQSDKSRFVSIDATLWVDPAKPFAARLVGAVAAAATTPTYVKIEAPPARGPRAAGYGPYLGVIPEFGDSPRPGVKVSAVRAGSPAEKAGVRTGDLIVRFGPVAVKTLNDLTFALRGQRPGDRVELWLLRDGAEERVEAVLQERRQ